MKPWFQGSLFDKRQSIILNMACFHMPHVIALRTVALVLLLKNKIHKYNACATKSAH